MATPVVSPAYQQIVQWYGRFQGVEMSRPIPLLVTTGAPDETADPVKATNAGTQTLDVFA